jgi:putative ABC transport system permease protein
LSYRKSLSKAEKIVEGKDFDEVKSQYPKVSIERKFAERLNLSLGDILTFDIQDVEMKAEVINFRAVNWFSFQPNFFVLFEDGVLNDAPKTFLATIGHVEASSDLQYQLASKFPNISMIDLDRVVLKVLEISKDFEFVLTVMSYFCIIMGIFVFLSIYIHFMERRRFDMQIMKVLGFSFRRIFVLGLAEYAISLGYAVGLGLFIGSMLSYLLVVYYFEWTWTFDYKAVLLQSLIVFFVSFVLMVLLTMKDFLKKPQSLLKTES